MLNKYQSVIHINENIKLKIVNPKHIFNLMIKLIYKYPIN